MTARQSILEFDSLRKWSVGWGGWFEFAGFNGFVVLPNSMASQESVGTGVCLKWFVKVKTSGSYARQSVDCPPSGDGSYPKIAA